jgi:GTPase SAR1 family protein
MSKNVTKIPVSHRHEWISKRRFEDVIEPWYLPFEWSIRDFGIDGQVEITKSITDTTYVQPQGLYFFVQLKCAEEATRNSKCLTYQIPVKKILQWYGSNLPVLFTVYDMKSLEFLYLWIDDNLINTLDSSNPKWTTKESVTLKLPLSNTLSQEKLPELKEYVGNWKQPSKKIIEPGLYFTLKGKCQQINRRFASIAQPFQFESVRERVALIEKQIHEAIYRVAITGPSRSGKSTLINAMLRKKEVSPTGIFQTTGVPIQILPGEREYIQILFEDSNVSEHPLSGKIIRRFASQDENINNQKKVSLVTIFTKNPELEKGISLFDIPGLDDPQENIYEHAWLIVKKSNAILYLIDAAVAEHGGFVFKSEYKKHILELSQSLDKIFLVFNKINALSPTMLVKLKKKVEDDLKRLNLFDKVAEKIYYISAEESLTSRTKKLSKQNGLRQLENDLWQFLLKENKIGLRRLSSSLENVMQSIKDFSSLLQTRLLDISKKRKLVAALSTAQKKTPELARLFHQECNRATQAIVNHLEIQKNRALANLEKQLTDIPSEKELPDKQKLKIYLATTVKSTLESTDQLYTQTTHAMNTSVKSWIEGHLQHIWQIVVGSKDQNKIDMTEFESIEVPNIDFSNSIGVGAFSWLIGSVLAPGFAFAVGFVGFFSNLLLTVEERRTKRIKKLMGQIKTKMDDVYNRMHIGYVEAFKKRAEQIRQSVNNTLNLYFSDLHQQVAKINIPIIPDEEQKYNNALSNIESLRNEVIELNRELISWHSSF